MKKSIFLNVLYLSGLVLLAVISYAFASSENEKPSSSVADVSIQFGRGPNCTSRGLCNVDAPSGARGSNGAAAQMAYHTNDQMAITIYKADISVSTMEIQFADGIFHQLEPTSFPNFASAQPESDPPITIEAGTYRVNDLGDRYTIIF